MARQEKTISELTNLSTVDRDNDLIMVVDVSDTSQSAQGTTKKTLVSQFIGETGAPGQDGEDGREVEIQNSGTYVQWRYAGDAAWTNLVALADITGADGTNGTDGREVQLRKGTTHIQWKYEDEVTWTDLIAVSELVGATGAPGSDGEDAYVYIAYASDASGTGFTTTFNADLDYIAIKSTNTEIVTPQASDFTGLWKNYKGAQGIQGIPGEQGLPGADGEDGASSYTYIAYASDSSGAGFTTTFNANLDYIAIKTTTSPIASPQASDFTGLWKNYKGERGIQGEPGEDGLDITWRGVYSAETAYVVNDAVYYGGSSYICILASTGNLPTDETYWNLMAQQGAAGEGSGDVTGPDGATDNAIARFDLSTGKIIQDSLVTIDDSGSINIPSGQQYLVNGSPVEGYSDEQAQDAVGTILTDSSEIDFTYTDEAPSITASLKSGSIDETKLDISVNASLDLADSAVQPGDLATVATSGAYSDLTDKPTIPSTFDDLTDGTTNKAYTATEKTKLFGIAESANNYSHPNHSGDVTSVGDGATTIANGAVTNAKMANMATKTYKGRTAGTTGAPEDVPVATLKTDLALVKEDVGLGNVDNTSDATKNSAVATLTNKTINADNNTISNLEVDNLKAGVLDTDLSSVSASDDTLPSAKAVKAYVDAQGVAEYIFNVKHYGAAGDGSTEDGEAFQDALDACDTAGGGIVFIPEGTYLLEKTPLVGDNTRVIGAGAATILTGGRDSGDEGHALISHKNIDEDGYDGVTNISFENFAIDSPLTNGITLSHAENVYISNIYGIDVYQHFIDIGGVKNLIAENLYLTGQAGASTIQFNYMSGGQTIWTGSTSTAPNYDNTPPLNIKVRDSFITATHASEHGQTGNSYECSIHFHRGNSSNIEFKNVVTGGKDIGMYKDEDITLHSLLCDGLFMKNGKHGVYFEDADGYMSYEWKFLNCTVEKVTGFGIRVPDCTNVFIDKCHLQGDSSSNSAISFGSNGVSTGDNGTVTNCVIDGFSRALNSGSSTNAFQGRNTITNCTSHLVGITTWKSAYGRVKIGNFSMNTSTGNQSVTGIGFQPKLLHFYVAWNDRDDRASYAEGFYDGTSQFALASTITASGGAGFRRFSASQAFKNLNSSDGSDYNAFTGVSMDSDGFTVNITTTNGGTVYYIAYE